MERMSFCFMLKKRKYFLIKGPWGINMVAADFMTWDVR